MMCASNPGTAARVAGDPAGIRTAVQEIFAEALLLEAGERSALVMAGARGDRALRVMRSTRSL